MRQQNLTYTTHHEGVYMIKFGKKRSILAALTGFVLVAATAALAAWILTASNTTWVTKAGTLNNVTFSAAAFPTSGTLLPGGTNGLSAAVNNPNSTPVTIRSTTGMSTVNGAVLPAGCSPSNFSVQTAAFVGVSIPPGASTVNIPGAISMDSAAPTECQGVNVEVNLNSLTYGVGS